MSTAVKKTTARGGVKRRSTVRVSPRRQRRNPVRAARPDRIPPKKRRRAPKKKRSVEKEEEEKPRRWLPYYALASYGMRKSAPCVIPSVMRPTMYLHEEVAAKRAMGAKRALLSK